MSRIGKLPISIPAGVTVTLKDDVVTVKGPKGEMSQYVNPAINVAIEDGHVVLAENEKKQCWITPSKSMHSMVCTVLWFTTWLLVYLKDIKRIGTCRCRLPCL